MAGWSREKKKSNNAVIAEEAGCRTASSLAKLLGKGTTKGVIEEVFEPASWHHTSGGLRGVVEINYYYEPLVESWVVAPEQSPEERRSTVRQSVEDTLACASDSRDVHHLSQLLVRIVDDGEWAALLAESQAKIDEAYRRAADWKAYRKGTETITANLKWEEFSYSRSRGWRHERTVTLRAVTVTLKGDWAILEHAGKTLRKKINGKGFEIEKLPEATS